MKLLSCILLLTLALGWAHSQGGGHPPHEHDYDLDRCKGLEMDAVAVNEEGIPYFFKGDHLYKGFHGLAELSNESFAELDDHHHLGHVDAAFHMHFEDNPDDHDRMFFFLDNKVFSFYKHKLEAGYPKDISEVFPGIPNDLDAAVEEKEFKSMPNCTSAFRFMEHYYCFHGHMFSKFDPKTGEVHGKYPKEARDYFMRCSKFSPDSDHVERERCSRVHLDAITSDNAGNIYAFRGHHYLRKDDNDTLTSDTIENDFKELHSEVDAAFSYENHLYLIKNNNLYVYRVGEPHIHLDGYPKPVTEELGIEGPIDAAFVCEDHHIAHIIKGNQMHDVELKVTPRKAGNERPIGPFKRVDTAMCGPGGVKVIIGNHFYHFDSTKLLSTARSLPEQHKVSLELFGCDH
uniref:Hemopexin n=1 Tax=Astatotilapia calliptera TaxID=8154 RepID=A0AAX7SDC5_ASTCA